MNALFTVICAGLLAIERVTYWFAWTHPGRFRARVRRIRSGSADDPVAALRTLFYVFKAIQIGVLLGWCAWFGETWLPVPEAPLPVLALGVALLVFGQVLNVGVMLRLGDDGVFYGNRFGRPVAWQTGFPFSLFAHPQYLGAALSVWGFMLAMRYPHPDWIVLPLVSSIYYVLGARLESRIPSRG